VDEVTRGLVAAGVATHHRDLPEILERYPVDSPDARPRLLAQLDAQHETWLSEWLTGRGAPDLSALGFRPLPALDRLPTDQSLTRAFRAFRVLAEALDSEAATSTLSIQARSMRGLVVLADHAGSAHVQLKEAAVLESVDALRARVPTPLWPHQEACSALVGHGTLRAPTGSGKTEAALLWAARQRQVGPGCPPLFYVLPYRASLNAMRFRLPRRYGVSQSAVALQHSSAMAALYAHLLTAKGYTREAASRAARAERDLGRLKAAAVRVLTPYQLLRAFFGLPGHEAVLTDAAGGLFVWDELHAYDLPRLALILAATRHLARDLGARFLAMSATLPGVLAQAFTWALGSAPVEVVATPDTFAAFRRHVLRLAAHDLLHDATVDRAVSCVRRGDAVLLVANTVARSRWLYERLLERLGPEGVELLHGRFTGHDRSEKEARLIERLETGRERTAGCALVATQVVEVSLDVDFDVLFSDPAPIEALLQRFGRVNRARRRAPCEVVVHTMRPPGVYGVGSVERSLQVLRRHDGACLDEAQAQSWVDETYGPVAEAWRRTLDRLTEEARTSVVEAVRPLASHPELAERFDEMFDGMEVVPVVHEAEYRQRLLSAPLHAPALYVPVSASQAHRLRHLGKLRRDRASEHSFWVADVPYDSSRGLDLTFGDEEA
jgi:CRISPR-associated endonuclease/helicase Cas3